MLITVSKSFVARDSLALFGLHTAFVKAVARIRVLIRTGSRERGHLLISLSALQGCTRLSQGCSREPKDGAGLLVPTPSSSTVFTRRQGEGTADFCFSLLLFIGPLKKTLGVWDSAPNSIWAGCDILTTPLSSVPGDGGFTPTPTSKPLGCEEDFRVGQWEAVLFT